MITFKLDKLLCDMHMSYSELAAMTSISEKKLRFFAAGNVHAVKISTLNLLCEALECSLDELIDYCPPNEAIYSK